MSSGAAPERGHASAGREPLQGAGWRAVASPWLGPAFAVATALLGGILHPHLPARVPTHWGMDGQPNGWMSPLGAVVFMPVLILGTWALLAVLARVLPTIPSRGPERRAFFLTINLVFAFMAIIQALVLWAAAEGGGVAVERWTFVLVGALFVALAGIMPLLPNGGINLPGVDAASEYGARMLRFLRVDFTVGGALLICTLFLPARAAGIAALCLIFAVSLMPLGYLAVRPPPVRLRRKSGGAGPAEDAGPAGAKRS